MTDNLKASTDKKTEKNNRFSKRVAILLLVGTLIVDLVAGYFICSNYFWKSDLEKAREVILAERKATVEKSPNDPAARVELGYAYQMLDKFDEAEEQYETALSLDKDNYAALLNLATVQEAQDNPDAALTNLKKAEKITSSDYKVFLLKGRCYLTLKMYKQAKEALQEAKSLEPMSVEIIYLTGLVAEAEGDKKSAQAIFEEALAKDPLYKEASEALKRVKGK